MVNLAIIHYAYLASIIIIIAIMAYKKDVVLPCLIGIALIGFIATRNILRTIQIIYRSVVVSGREFIEIIVIISLISAMSKALKDIGADELMIKPMKKLMVSSTLSFFVLGFTMLITSWFIWPTPAIAFIGTIMVPAAVESGLPAIWAAVSLNLFGNGVALSSDFFIQAAPSITSKALGETNPFYLIKASIFPWAIMSIFTIAASFILMKKDISNNFTEIKETPKIKIENNHSGASTKSIAIITPLIFIIDILLMYIFKLKGEESTSLIGGTAVVIMSLVSVIKYDFKRALGEVAGYIKDGFIFGMKIFAPIIIIGAFFFLGSKETAVEILGPIPGSNGILADIGMFLSHKIPITKLSTMLMQISISALLGIGGSGFSGLPLIGTLAGVFSPTVHISKEILAALGQITTIWIGGGTIIPWSVVPIAAVCDVQPFELAKKNFIPVIIGLIFMVLTSIIFT